MTFGAAPRPRAELLAAREPTPRVAGSAIAVEVRFSRDTRSAAACNLDGRGPSTADGRCRDVIPELLVELL